MKLTSLLFEKFGDLGYHTKNQIWYTMSSFEQNPVKGVFSKGIPNGIRRFKSRIVPIAIPGVIYYYLYQYAQEAQRLYDRKNPKDFENDS